MKNLTCSTCGSNTFREEEKIYRCEYCGATKVKPVLYSKKKSLFIILALTVILIGGLMGYQLLYSVKKDINQLAQKQISPSPEPKTTHKNYRSDYSEQNPFSDTILRVEGSFGTNNKGNKLEEAIKHYQGLEKNKAFYLSLGRDGEYAFGLAHGAKSTRSAEKEALAICKKEKKKLNLADSCIPYGVNDHLSRLLIK